MSWIQRLFKEKEYPWTYGSPDTLKGPNRTEPRLVKKNSEYIRVVLKSSRIPYSRKGFTTYYGVVHSFISLLHKSGVYASFHSVNTPGNLQQLSNNKLNRVINIGKDILGPLPYRGDKLELEIGLLSVPADNLAKPFLETLSKMSSVAGVSFVATAQPFVEPIEAGVSLLTGAKNAPELEIGLYTTLHELQTGYYAAISAPKGQLKTTAITIDETDFSLFHDGKLIDDYSYFVFEVIATTQRDDWFNIPHIHEPHEELLKAITTPDINMAKKLLAKLSLAIQFSPDILRPDADILLRNIDTDIKQAIAIIEGNSEATRSDLTTEEQLARYLKPLDQYKIYSK